MNMSLARVGNIEIGNGRGLVLIAGPCVIESEDLCMEVGAKALEITKTLGIPYIFKASFDKANRTPASHTVAREWMQGSKCWPV